MDARQAIFQTIRSRLTGSALMASRVASSSITVSRQRPVTAYPAIRMRVVGARGANLTDFIAGDVYLNIYTEHRNPAGALASTYSVVRTLLHNKVTQLSTTNIGIGTFREQYVDYPLYEEEPGVFYLASRYSFTAQNLT